MTTISRPWIFDQSKMVANSFAEMGAAVSVSPAAWARTPMSCSGFSRFRSAPRQMYLQELFGFRHPEYAHIPMLMAPEGRRLSKRDQDLDMGALRNRLKPEQLIGVLAHAAGLTETAAPISAKELATVFDWSKIKGKEIVVTELEKLYR